MDHKETLINLYEFKKTASITQQDELKSLINAGYGFQISIDIIKRNSKD